MSARPVGAPLLLGHRGSPRTAPENTVAAFGAALAEGADGVELDVRRTADGALVVHHDAEVPGLGPVLRRTAAEWRTLCPGMPTLAEALAACAGHVVNVEVKNLPTEPDWDLADRAAASLPAAFAAARVGEPEGPAWVVVSSFGVATIDRLRLVDAAVPTGLLVRPGDPLPALEVAVARGHDALHPCDAGLAAADAARVVERCHDAGVRCHVWTVDDPDRIRLWADCGADAIITNVPGLAVSLLRR